MRTASRTDTEGRRRRDTGRTAQFTFSISLALVRSRMRRGGDDALAMMRSASKRLLAFGKTPQAASLTRLFRAP